MGKRIGIFLICISETNLKVKQALKETTELENVNDLIDFKGVIECELPNKDLYNFDGAMWQEADPHHKLSLTNKQVLLRVYSSCFAALTLCRGAK